MHFDKALISNPDSGVYDREIKQILAGDPRAKVIPRIGLNYPCVAQVLSNSVTDDGGRVFGPENGYYPSFGSQQWEKDETALLRTIIKKFEKSYGKSVIGYQIGSGVCGEWCMGGTGSCIDFSPGAVAGW